MREFFRGWRRKVGCVTLAMALFWANEWSQSHLGGSMINLSRTKRILSLHGRVMLVMMNSGDHIRPWIRSQNGDIDASAGNIWSPEWRRTFAGMEIGRDVYGNANQHVDNATWYRVPHWSVVLPLTLLSAYLILTPSRKQPPT